MSLHADVSRFCAAIGADPLLVQGAGGNVSWKDGDALWIKASGTWLQQALEQNIFVPVALPELQQALAQGRFDISPRVLDGATLRPSIETVLHALMPHRIVVHLHAIEALAWLVRQDPWPEMLCRLPSHCSPCFVPYCKPGADLAQAVCGAVASTPHTQLVCMANHGIVIAANDLDEIQRILAEVCQALRAEHMPTVSACALPKPVSVDAQRCFEPINDLVVQRLDLSASGLRRMSQSWALYPDHVVFLGASPLCHDSVEAARIYCTETSDPVIDQPHFIRDVGVFSLQPLSASKLAQLRCYADVLLRQSPTQVLQPLTLEQVAALLNWDAERYRQQINVCR